MVKILWGKLKRKQQSTRLVNDGERKNKFFAHQKYTARARKIHALENSCRYMCEHIYLMRERQVIVQKQPDVVSSSRC